jgi:hypothetical protein
MNLQNEHRKPGSTVRTNFREQAPEGSGWTGPPTPTITGYKRRESRDAQIEVPI